MSPSTNVLTRRMQSLYELVGRTRDIIPWSQLSLASLGMLHRTAALRHARLLRRYNSTVSRTQPCQVYFNQAKSSEPSVSTTPDHLSPAQRDELERALRVDQAGEVAANYIYKGQLAVLGQDPQSGPLIKVFHSDYLQEPEFTSDARKCGTKRRNICM